VSKKLKVQQEICSFNNASVRRMSGIRSSGEAYVFLEIGKTWCLLCSAFYIAYLKPSMRQAISHNQGRQTSLDSTSLRRVSRQRMNRAVMSVPFIEQTKEIYG